MKAASQSGSRATTAMRWAGRIVGLIAVGLFLLFLTETGARILPELSWGNPQGIPLLLAMTVAVAGVLVAWALELIGGLMTLIGAVAIPILVYLGSGLSLLLAALILSLPLLICGGLCLGCCWRTRRASIS
jgi:hypothetical protein